MRRNRDKRLHQEHGPYISDSPPPQERVGTAEDTRPSRLSDVIACYRSAVNALPTEQVDGAAPRVARALLARDTVADTLSKHSSVNLATLKNLTDLDQQLKAKAATLTAIVGRETFANWREAVQPRTSSWWWSLDERTMPKPNPLWTILSVLLLAAAAALTAEMARRFLSSGGPDLAAISIPLLQAILTFLSGSTLTQTGQEWIERLLSRHTIARQYHPMLKTAIPLIIFLVIGGFYCSLPSFARYYARRYLHQQAFELQATGKLDQAIKHYERAISLDPDFALPHYNVGAAYEVLGDYDKSITAYQTALRLHPKFSFAQNNLARLLLVRRNDPATALQLLNAALDLHPQESRAKYSLYKNRGWAHFNLKCYSLAAADVCEALNLREDGAAAYCLLAQILEAQGKPQELEKSELCKAYKNGAAAAWEQCEAYKAGQEHEIEATWLSLAQERLRKADIK